MVKIVVKPATPITNTISLVEFNNIHSSTTEIVIAEITASVEVTDFAVAVMKATAESLGGSVVHVTRE